MPTPTSHSNIPKKNSPVTSRRSAVFATSILTLYAIAIGALNAQSLFERSFNDTSPSAAFWRSTLTTLYPHIRTTDPASEHPLLTPFPQHSSSPVPVQPLLHSVHEPPKVGTSNPIVVAQKPTPITPSAAVAPPAQRDSESLDLTASYHSSVPSSATDPQASSSAIATSPHQPVRVMTIGDSLAQGYAMAWARLNIKQLTEGTRLEGRKIELLDFAQHSTGIANVRYKNWPQTFDQLCSQKRPDMVIASFGANDLMGIYHQGVTVPFGSEQWVQLYEERLMHIAQRAQSCGARLVLVVPPIVQKTSHENMMVFVRKAHEKPCQNSSLCIRTHQVFSPQGVYTSSAPIDGITQTVRASDGVHLTMAGYTYVAKQALQHLIEQP